VGTALLPVHPRKPVPGAKSTHIRADGLLEADDRLPLIAGLRLHNEGRRRRNGKKVGTSLDQVAVPA